MNLAYPRLYWRMALYIGLAIAAFVVLGAVALVQVASQELENYSATRHSNLGHEAAKVLATGGVPALTTWLKEGAAIPPDVDVFILDSDSRDILGRPVPPAYASFIARFVVSVEDSESNYQPIRLAPHILDKDGTRYAFLVLPSRVTVWGSPAIALGVATAALLVIATVAWLIARAFGRPIGELQHAAREWAQGHLDARVPGAITARRDELGRLAADFNRMADQISSLLDGRQQLMRDLSHELRSPLSRLQAALALAATRGLTTADAQRIEQEIKRMDALIGDLLRLSRLDGPVPMARRIIRIDDLLAALVRDEEIEATGRGASIALQCQAGLTVVGDPELLRSGLENILRNAIRYTPAGAQIDIEAARQGGNVVVAVHDRGPGVPDAYLAKIFEPYVRVPRDEADATGTGLGLAIAQRVFAAHGGEVHAMPRPGGGLTMRVRLPDADLV